MLKDFEKYAISNGVGSNKLNGYQRFIEKTNAIVDPTIIEERERHVAAMNVTSALFMNRTLVLSGPVDADSATIINLQLLYLESTGNEDITLYINSPGGSITDGLSIYDTMNFIAPDVSTVCLGECASMGAVLLSSGQRGKRYALPHGEIMIHQASGGTGRAQCADIQIAAKEIQKAQDTIYRILSENTGKSFEEIAADADRDLWMTSQEAKEYGPYGLIDGILYKRKN